MLLSAPVSMLLVMCLLGATPAAVAAANPAEAPVARASASSSTEAMGDKRPLSVQAMEACEAAVTDSLRTLRGPGVQRIEFDPGQPVTVLPQDDEVPFKGTGRYAHGGAKGAAVPFTYGCNYNVSTGKTNGVVISDSKEAAASRSSTRGGKGGGNDPAWQPDLARLSPEACEAAVVVVLKKRHPRVGRIAFDAASRQLKPAADPERTLLQGQGGMQRAPGMAAAAFTYRCEFNDRSGVLADVQTSE